MKFSLCPKGQIAAKRLFPEGPSSPAVAQGAQGSSSWSRTSMKTSAKFTTSWIQCQTGYQGLELLLAGRNLCRKSWDIPLRVPLHTWARQVSPRGPHKLRLIINHISKCNMWSEHANKSKPQPRIRWMILIKAVQQQQHLWQHCSC